jgi:hypothetical protein
MSSLFPDHEPTREARNPVGEFHDEPRRTQKVLLSGLDCLPGQKDLFDVDGVAPYSAADLTRDTLSDLEEVG